MNKISELLHYAAVLVSFEGSSQAVSREIATAVAALRRAVALETGDPRALPVPIQRRLTPRDREVARLLARGATYKDVAQELGLSFMSAQSRVKTLYAKLGVHSKRELTDLLRST